LLTDSFACTLKAQKDFNWCTENQCYMRKVKGGAILSLSKPSQNVIITTSNGKVAWPTLSHLHSSLPLNSVSVCTHWKCSNDANLDHSYTPKHPPLTQWNTQSHVSIVVLCCKYGWFLVQIPSMRLAICCLFPFP
jgi:hypothetical protein